jgi:outer membrane protein OmpA-like peptidoglycan-associated protein
MKRLIFIFGALALAAVAMTASPDLNAQENGNRDSNGKVVRGPYETNRFGDNWFIGAGGGINILLNEGYDVRISPSIDANFGKWFTPSVGMRVGYQGFQTAAWAGDALQKYGYMYIHGDFLWNISNALSGYKETRFWNFVPYVHTGYFRSYGLDGMDFYDNEIAAGAGLLHNLRLADRLDLIVDMRATVVNGRIIKSSGIALLPSVTMGLAVDLGWPNFIRSASVIGAVEAANVAQIEALEAAAIALELANATLEQQNQDLSKKNSKLNAQVNSLMNQPKPESETAFFESMTPAPVYFDIGKAVLSDREMQHLDFLAKNLVEKADKDTKIYLTVMGSADSNTGSAKRNQYLSEARAKYIYDVLTDKYGVSPDRLIVKSEVKKGGADPKLARAVMIHF